MDFHLVPRGTDRNYTGFLTKTIVYSATLVLFLACELDKSSPRATMDPPLPTIYHMDRSQAETSD